jgi:hypothetical protein
MMVQSAPAGQPHFVSTMAEHNDLCGQFARAYGNAEFEPLDPFEEMLYVVSHHDRGWDAFDADPGFDAKDGLPRGLGATPPPVGIESNRKSADLNERRHAYCGLLSSMHGWGLFNARYGLSQFRVRHGGSTSVPIPEPYKEIGDAMLSGELRRQERLKAELAGQPQTRAWIDDRHLFQNYKQLQFFDTLALYFNLRHESERREEVYTHVPRTADEDASVTVRPLGGGAYGLRPFPFAGDRLVVACRGRYVRKLPVNQPPADMGAFLAGLPIEVQTHTLVAG